MEDKTFFLNKQQVRLIDIFVYSPFCFWAATKTENKIAKYGLVFLGISTLAYNAINYQKEKLNVKSKSNGRNY